jgi:hypothetical protein
MLASLHHYEELAQLKGFFQDWYGLRWEQLLHEEIGVSKGEIRGVLARSKSFSKTLLPRLRKLRATVMDTQSGLAKPSHARRESMDVLGMQRLIDSVRDAQ